MKPDSIQSSGHKHYNEAIFAWEINNVCHYRCSYCYCRDRLSKTFDTKYKQVYKNVLKKLSLNRIKNYKVEILGGEPTLHPNIREILETLSVYKECNGIELVTNLAKSKKYFATLNDIDKLHISASFHPEYHDEKFVNKCEHVNNDVPSFGVVVNLPCDNRHWQHTLNAMHQLLQKNIHVKYNYLHSVDGIFEAHYTEEFYDMFKTTLSLCDNKKTPFKTIDGNTQYVDEWYIRKHKLMDFHDKFKCTPGYWYIDLEGNIDNICTRERLNPIATNLRTEVTCPVAESCSICNMLFEYYKERI